VLQTLSLNHYNIRTAIDRAGRFVSTRTTRANLLVGFKVHGFVGFLWNADRFVVFQYIHLQAARTIESSSKSEAPEDDLLALPSPALFEKWSAKPDALDTKRYVGPSCGLVAASSALALAFTCISHSLLLNSSRGFRFWKLIDETEKLVNFGIAAFKTGSALSNLTTALMRLGVGRTTILQYVEREVSSRFGEEKRLT
jgi:hypothetical protein